MRLDKRSWTIRCGLLAALAITALPSPGLAQDPPAPRDEVSDETLTSFATAFLAISAVRDEVNNELGRVHDVQGKAAIRARLEQQVSEILATHELTAKDYQRLIYGVSADPALRERFEQILQALKPKPPGG
jgi:hypothetical protein